MEIIDVALALYVLAQIADVLSTVRGLERGAHEANGFMAILMKRLGYWWVPTKLTGSGAAAAVIYVSGYWWLLMGLAILVGLVAARNWRFG